MPNDDLRVDRDLSRWGPDARGITRAGLIRLPDEPDVWGDAIDGYRQRWTAGAFGSRPTIAGVTSFRVIKDEWQVDEHEQVSRTIHQAEAVAEERSPR